MDAQPVVVAYLCLDPGDTTGWATFDASGNVIKTGHLLFKDGREAVYEFLKTFMDYTPFKEGHLKVICEDFQLYPWKAMQQSWSDLNTARVIGVIEYWCYLTGCSLIMQSANIKPIAYKWAGITKPKQKLMTHSMDAYVHGVYYLQSKGIRKPQQGS